ncbi:MAG: hypothetical protein J1F31_01510 [Erysipelotrichales bacterium]|nr:hypothetical protein [Erysipelotrichales bacterium]
MYTYDVVAYKVQFGLYMDVATKINKKTQQGWRVISTSFDSQGQMVVVYEKTM